MEMFLALLGILLFIAVLILAYLAGERTGKAIAKHDIEESRRETEEQERLAHQRRMQRKSKEVRQRVAVEPATRPKPKLVASMGKRVDEGNLVRANFRNKGPNNSGPKGAA